MYQFQHTQFMGAFLTFQKLEQHTYKDAAFKTGISKATISRIMRGALPSMADFLALCDYMAQNPTHFFEKMD